MQYEKSISVVLLQADLFCPMLHQRTEHFANQPFPPANHLFGVVFGDRVRSETCYVNVKCTQLIMRVRRSLRDHKTRVAVMCGISQG